MRKTMGMLALICTILISTVISGSAEMILNVGSIIIVFGTYSAGFLLSKMKLDDILVEFDKEEKNVNIMDGLRELTKRASIFAIILSFVISGLNLIYNYTNIHSIG